MHRVTIIAVTVLLAALAVATLAYAYPVGSDNGAASTGSCGYWNTWQSVNVGGSNPWVCYPDGYWHEQRGGWDLGVRAD